MKKILKTITILSALVLSVQALAAPMAPELKVKGSLAVPACNVNSGGTDGSGTYDLGKISSSLIKPSTVTALTEKALIWSIVCEAETYLSFSVVDNREGTASQVSDENFGLGNVNGSGKLGFYRVAMDTAVVDGSNSNVYSTSTASSFTAASSIYLAKNKRMGWAQGNNTQKSGRDFKAVLRVQPSLASSSQMNGPVTDSTKLDGAMTLNFAFGL